MSEAIDRARKIHEAATEEWHYDPKSRVWTVQVRDEALHEQLIEVGEPE